MACNEWLCMVSKLKSKSRSSPPEVSLGKCVLKKAANLQENTHAKVWFKESYLATLLKLHLGIDAVLKIFCIFSEHLFIWTTF